jgi:hypothetical protein
MPELCAYGADAQHDDPVANDQGHPPEGEVALRPGNSVYLIIVAALKTIAVPTDDAKRYCLQRSSPFG